MSKKSEDKLIGQEMGDQSQPVELNDQQLDTITGGETSKTTTTTNTTSNTTTKSNPPTKWIEIYSYQ